MFYPRKILLAKKPGRESIWQDVCFMQTDGRDGTQSNLLLNCFDICSQSRSKALR